MVEKKIGTAVYRRDLSPVLAIFRLVPEEGLSFPPYRAGLPKIASLPAGVDAEEARGVLAMAVDYANLFHHYPRDRQTGIHLEFLPDGRSARCCLSRGWYHGPLAAGGESFIVLLQKVGNAWFVVGGWEGGSWIS